MMAKPFPHFPRRPHPWRGPPSKGTFFPPRPSVTPISPPPAGGKSHKSPLCRRRAAPWDRPIPWISPHPSTPIEAAYVGEGGTGGKAPKRPLRRLRRKPYDPPAGRTLFPAAVEKKNWLTELVYSASRTIARSCSLLFSSVFSIINAVLTEAPRVNYQLEIKHLLSKKSFTRAQSIRINELLQSKTPELSTLERQESGRQSIGSDTTISASAVKPMEFFDMDDDSVSLTEEPAFRIAIPEDFLEISDDEDNFCDTALISTSLTIPVLEKPSFQMTAPEDFLEIVYNEDNSCDTGLNSTSLTIPVLEKPSFRMTAPEDFLEIVDDEDNSCDIGLNSTSFTIPVLEKPSFQMTAPEDISESDNDDCDLNDTEFSFHVSHAPQPEHYLFGPEQCWHPAQRTSL